MYLIGIALYTVRSCSACRVEWHHSAGDACWCCGEPGQLRYGSEGATTGAARMRPQKGTI